MRLSETVRLLRVARPPAAPLPLGSRHRHEGALHPGWAWHFLTSPTVGILAQEVRMTMQLCGARTIAELDAGLIRHR